MKVLYNYKPYDLPKKALFETYTGEYDSKNGWVQEIVTKNIIGECDDCYIERLQETENGYWEDDLVVYKKIVLPVGIHKSRFVKWLVIQMSLFN